MFKFLDFFRKTNGAACGAFEDSRFNRKHASFKRPLLANNRALEIVADLENTIYQDQPFTCMCAVSQTESLVVGVDSLAKDLNELSGDKYPELPQAAQRIAEKIYAEPFMKGNYQFAPEAADG